MEHFALGKILLWSGRFEDAKKFHMGVAYGRARFDLVPRYLEEQSGNRERAMKRHVLP